MWTFVYPSYTISVLFTSKMDGLKIYFAPGGKLPTQKQCWLKSVVWSSSIPSKLGILILGADRACPKYVLRLGTPKLRRLCEATESIPQKRKVEEAHQRVNAPEKVQKCHSQLEEAPKKRCATLWKKIISDLEKSLTYRKTEMIGTTRTLTGLWTIRDQWGWKQEKIPKFQRANMVSSFCSGKNPWKASHIWTKSERGGLQRIHGPFTMHQ